MEVVFSPLSEDELDELERFLLDRIDEDAVTDDYDEGVLNVSELDGFFTAIVSGPQMVLPSQWLPALWGDIEPEWRSDGDFEHVISLLLRHMNDIAGMLMEQPEEFEPLFLEREAAGETFTVVDEWCEGYQRGIALAEEAWFEGGAELVSLLTPVLAFSSATQWRGHELSEEDMKALQLAIIPNVREIHAYWLARRDDGEVFAPSPARRGESRVGRNDPCPCGSGKKYKKCCLH